MGNPLDVVTRFTADVAGIQKGAADAQTAIGKVGPQAAITSLAVVGMATAAVGAIGAMTIAAADDEAAQALLEEAYRNTGAATGDYVGQINAAIDAGTSLGFTDDKTRAALTSLITATGDAATANADLKTAQDIARFAGVDLAVAADAVAKAQAGQATQLTRLLPGLEKGKTATETLANAQRLAAGSADTYAASTKGQGDVANASLVQLTQTIGAAFIPVLSELTSILVGVAKVMNDNAGVVKVLVAVVGLLAVGILAANIAMKAMEAIQIAVKVATAAWTAIQWLLNAALDANPIGLVVIAIAALVAGLILVYQNSKQVRDAIGGIIDFLKNLLDWIGRAVDAVGKLIDALNPLKGISLPSLPSLPFSASAGASAGAFGTVAPYAVSGTVNVNVYGGDPRAVTRAVKDGFRRWTATEGKNAPGQDW